MSPPGRVFKSNLILLGRTPKLKLRNFHPPHPLSFGVNRLVPTIRDSGWGTSAELSHLETAAELGIPNAHKHSTVEEPDFCCLSEMTKRYGLPSSLNGTITCFGCVEEAYLLEGGEATDLPRPLLFVLQ